MVSRMVIHVHVCTYEKVDWLLTGLLITFGDVRFAYDIIVSLGMDSFVVTGSNVCVLDYVTVDIRKRVG